MALQRVACSMRGNSMALAVACSNEPLPGQCSKEKASALCISVS